MSMGHRLIIAFALSITYVRRAESSGMRLLDRSVLHSCHLQPLLQSIDPVSRSFSCKDLGVAVLLSYVEGDSSYLIVELPSDLW